MKKTISIVMSVLLAISMLAVLSSCKSQKSSADTADKDNKISTSGKETDNKADAESGKNEKPQTVKNTNKEKLKPSTTKIRKKNVEKTKPASLDYRALAEEYGTVSAFEQADYDGNGDEEAFAIITNSDETIAGVLFVDCYGEVTVLAENLDWALYMSEDGNIRYCGGKGFFWADMGAYGSGWKTLVYSVKNGKPYKLDISDELQGFYEDNGRLYTTEDEFTDKGHIYNSIELIYNSKTQQFKKGGKIETEK